MSVETDFRALLLAASGVTALVGQRIAQDLTDGGYPAIGYSVQHAPITDMGGAVLADQCAISVRCSAQTAAQAAAVADAVAAALAGAPASSGARVTERATSYDPEAGIYDHTLSVEWWAV